MAKAVVNRVKKILLDIILKDQTRFVSRRSILDGVIIAQETIHSTQNLKRKNMLIKLDIKKTMIGLIGIFSSR